MNGEACSAIVAASVELRDQLIAFPSNHRTLFEFGRAELQQSSDDLSFLLCSACLVLEVPMVYFVSLCVSCK